MATRTASTVIQAIITTVNAASTKYKRRKTEQAARFFYARSTCRASGAL